MRLHVEREGLSASAQLKSRSGTNWASNEECQAGLYSVRIGNINIGAFGLKTYGSNEPVSRMLKTFLESIELSILFLMVG